MADDTKQREINFLKGGGEMGSHIRNLDWSVTKLGIPEYWPQSLKTSIGILLNSRVAMILFWTEENLCFFNDRYACIFENSQERIDALGKPAAQLWADEWNLLRPLIESFKNGSEPDDEHFVMLPVNAEGKFRKMPEANYSAVYGEEGNVCGVLGTCIQNSPVVYSNFAGKEFQNLQSDSAVELQLLRDTVPAMIFYLDSEQRYQSYNQMFCQWFGVNSTEALGKSVKEFLGDIAHQKTKPHLDIAYSGMQERYEMYAPSKMGSPRWLDIIYTPHKDREGNVVGIIVHATDVTRSKQVELALRESEMLLKAVIQAAPVGISLFVGEDFIIENPNDNFITLLGKGESIAGKPLVSVLGSAENDLVIQTLKKVYYTGTEFTANAVQGVAYVENKEVPGFFNISLTPLFDSEGNVHSILSVSTDVTEEVVSRKKIEEAEQIFRGAVELAELGTWNLDVLTGETVFSQRHAEMFGFHRRVLSSNDAMSVVETDDFERVLDLFNKALKPGSDGKYEAEYRIINASTGRRQVIHAQGQAYFDKDGKPTNISGTARDITIERELQSALENEVAVRTLQLQDTAEELKRLNNKLEDANKALTRSNEELAQYAYVASHDLQEPLRKIRLFSSLLKDGKRDSESYNRSVDRISFAAERMSQLIADLLDFSRLLQQEAVMQPVNLNTVANSVWNDFELVVEEKGATASISQLPEIHAVSIQINQLFYNLISNSLKFTSEGVKPHISIEWEMADGLEAASHTGQLMTFEKYYHIIFKDNGIGFDTQHSDQIFEIFKRLHGQESYEGSGIGLALCRRIVANHQGFLFAESEPGKGSAFHVYIPVQEFAVL